VAHAPSVASIASATSPWQTPVPLHLVIMTCPENPYPFHLRRPAASRLKHRPPCPGESTSPVHAWGQVGIVAFPRSVKMTPHAGAANLAATALATEATCGPLKTSKQDDFKYGYTPQGRHGIPSRSSSPSPAALARMDGGNGR